VTSEPLECRRLLSAAIAGTVFNDADADGVRDPGEGVLAGRTVYLDANANGTRDAGETGATSGLDGAYAFADLAPGTYLVRLAAVNDFAQTYPGPTGPTGSNAGYTVTVADGQTAAGYDFGAIATGSLPRIHGAVFRDGNENGTREAGELNVFNYTVYIDANDSGQRDAGEPSYVSNPNGYGFSGLLPGTYVLRVLPAGQLVHVTTPSPLDDAAHAVTLTMGQLDTSRDFGVAPVYQAASFGPIADAYVRDGDAAGTVFGSDPQLLVQRSDTVGSNAETYVRLDAANYPEIRSFKLRLYGGLVPGTGDGSPVEVAAYAQGGGGSVSYNWTEANLTWNNKPGAANDIPLASVTVAGADPQWYELDLSTYVRQARATGQQAIPIVLKATSAGGNAVSFASRNNPDSTIRPRQMINIESDPPVVTQVLAGGSGWTKEFKLGLQARSMGAGGFVLPPGGALGASSPVAPQPLPWTNVNAIRVRFNENVAIINTKALVFTAADGTRIYPLDARFDALSLTATWTFAKPFAAGRYTVDVDPSIVKDNSGNLLNAGAWLPLQLNVLPGDVNRDGRVNAVDLYDVRARLGRSAGNPPSSAWAAYSPFADVTADGRIDAFDYATVRARQYASLGPTAALFGSARVARGAAALVDSAK
jgi:hypothetical protein